MSHDQSPIVRLLEIDDRYSFDAYLFVREGLNYAVEVLQLGQPEESFDLDSDSSDYDRGSDGERHITGQELCDALRRYAIHQYGFLAKIVLREWGVHSTSDFGEIVYNMIKVGLMKQSDEDHRSHFDDIYDFDVAFEEDFEISQAAVYWPG